MTPDTSVGSLSLRERAGVRVLMVDAQPMRRPESAFGESIIAKIFQVVVWRQTPRSAPSPYGRSDVSGGLG